ncbi:MAG: YdaU family protein [Dehalococcoidia bacterium]|nr:YdaU family protein [Dehalococcoidia bacterium]
MQTGTQTQSDNDKLGATVVNSCEQLASPVPQIDVAPGLSRSEAEVSDSLHWFPWFPNRWIGSLSVKCMTLAEKGAYRELLDWQWQGRGYLPADLDLLSQVVGFDVKTFSRVLSKFPECGEGKRANGVLLSIWQDQVQKHGRRSCAGKRRWQSEKNQTEEEDKDKDKDKEAYPHALHDALHDALHKKILPAEGASPKEPFQKLRSRNPLMDALGKLDAAGGNVEQITKSGWSSIAGALRDIREVTPEVTPEEIERRAANYRTQFPADTRITAHALAKHWARCAEPGQKVARPVLERRHVDPRI